MNKKKIIYFRNVNISDADLILSWINDNQVIKNSFRKKKISKKNNLIFWKKKIQNNSFDSIIFFCNKKPFGIFSANKKNLDLNISYLISKNFRKKKLATELLKRGIKFLKKKYKKNFNIYAKVKKNNIISLFSLHSAGFGLKQINRKSVLLYYKNEN